MLFTASTFILCLVDNLVITILLNKLNKIKLRIRIQIIHHVTSSENNVRMSSLLLIFVMKNSGSFNELKIVPLVTFQGVAEGARKIHKL